MVETISLTTIWECYFCGKTVNVVKTRSTVPSSCYQISSVLDLILLWCTIITIASTQRIQHIGRYNQIVLPSDKPTCDRCIWKHERFSILCCHLVYYCRYVSEKYKGLRYRNFRTQGLISWFTQRMRQSNKHWDTVVRRPVQADNRTRLR